jgi:hypothetical protein
LAGALGGLGAIAASAIGRASPAQATNGDPVTVGGSFSGTGTTQIGSSATSAFVGISSNSDGTGVLGLSAGSSGTGVLGSAYSLTGANTGVYGYSASPSGIGVHATTNGGGVALKADGRAKFSTSGVATITAGHTTKVITPGVNVTSNSFVLLTPKVKLSGRDLWFTTDAANNKFTIRMSSSRSSGTKVAWLLLG